MRPGAERWRCYVCDVESETGGEAALNAHVVTRSHLVSMVQAFREEIEAHRAAITKSEEAIIRHQRLAEEATS